MDYAVAYSRVVYSAAEADDPTDRRQRDRESDPGVRSDLQHAARLCPRLREKTLCGLTVHDDVPNTDSIGATFDDWEHSVLPGIRSVPLTAFDDPGRRFSSADDNRRVEQLTTEIVNNKWIKPLIVVVDHETRKTGNAYILEGGHRLPALHSVGVTHVPAVVVVHHAEPPTE